MPKKDIELPHIQAHRYSRCNRKKVAVSDICGCFFCVATFEPIKIHDWDEGFEEKNDSALCPRCGNDTVLPSAAGFPVTLEFLKKMRNHWFWDPSDSAGR